jgi:CubicO group peptidase (beta-lactamase class C family)
MPFRMPYLLTSVLLLLCLGVTINSSAREPTDFTPVRRLIERAIDSGEVPSFAIAVVKDGQIIWEEGFGMAGSGSVKPATAHTMYSLASISKPITATGLMMLVDQGTLKLDSPVNDYLGDAKVVSRADETQQASVRQLANHSSGLPLHYQFFYNTLQKDVISRDESIRRYGVLVTPPGEVYQYANLGYGILDHVIERVSEQPFGTFMQEQVFGPLGMHHTALHAPANKTTLPVAERIGPDGKTIPYYGFDHDGASAFYSSAHDLARFAMFHLQTPLDDQTPPLTADSIKAMQTPTAPIDASSGYGIGWRIDEDDHGQRVVSHSGGMPGVRTWLVMLPEHKIAVVALTNRSSDLPFRAGREALSVLLPEYAVARRKAEREMSTFSPPQEFRPDAALAGLWRGTVETYAGSRQLTLWIHPDGDLEAQLAGQLKAHVSNARLTDGMLLGTFDADIDTADTDRSPYHLRLRLRVEKDRLSGNVSAVSINRSDSDPRAKLPVNSQFAVSHWLSLERISPLAGPLALFDGTQLGQWKVTDKFDFKNHGEIKAGKGVISLAEGAPASGIHWDGELPNSNYEISLQARRTSGSDFFCGLTFPVGESHCSFIVGGWGGGVVGMSNINNMSAVENETTGYLEVKDNRWYQIRVRVTDGHLRAWIDGESMVNIERADKKFSIWWEQEPLRPLGIASWNTAAELRNIRITYALDK